MRDPSPEVVAAAELTPLSPLPVHAASPSAVPELQDVADALDLTLGKPAAPAYTHAHAYAPTHANNMSDAEAGADTIVVGGGFEDVSEDTATDDSFDAYGEDDGSQGPGSRDDAGTDDYAKTFDSPPAEEADGTGQDVSKAQEMNSTSASDALTSEPPVAQPAADASTTILSNQLARPDIPEAVPVAASTDDGPNPSNSAPDAAQRAHIRSPTAEEEQDPFATGIVSDPDLDNRQLLDDMISNAVASAAGEPAKQDDRSPIGAAQNAQTSSSSSSILNVAQSSSLPPRPPQPLIQPDDFRKFQQGASSSNVPAAPSAPSPSSAQPSYMVTGAPGTNNEGMLTNLPPPPASSNYGVTTTFPSMPVSQSLPSPTTSSGDGQHEAQQLYDQFVADERRYMTEAKWERFPDGSRIFIGNLSSERVSKRDVFNAFHKHGRLAQISLKNAYGFVQYHNVADAQSAMDNLQGAEIRGRKIHLEFSRTQKKEKEKDKGRDGARSPDHRARGGRNDRFEGRDQGRRGRDDNHYRPARSPSPRRSDHRAARGDDPYGRDRAFTDPYSRRTRSRSPPYARRDGDPYRRRSPSPYRRGGPSDSGRLDIARRYGSDVPDVQLLLIQEVSRAFVDWVQRAFHEQGLKTDVLFLHPRLPRDTVIQRQVAEGVQAVVDLDMRAQQLGKIPLLSFSRTPGSSNARFDQYSDLGPTVAAQLVLRDKSQAAAQAQYAHGSYTQQYAAPQISPHTQTFPSAYPAAPVPHHQPSQSQDLTSLLSQMDSASLQQLIASIQAGGGKSAGPPAVSYTHMGNAPPSLVGGANAASSAANSHIDLATIMNNLKNASGAGNQATPAPVSVFDYASQAQLHGTSPMPAMGASPVGGGDAAQQQVQAIMKQLSRYR